MALKCGNQSYRTLLYEYIPLEKKLKNCLYHKKSEYFQGIYIKISFIKIQCFWINYIELIDYLQVLNLDDLWLGPNTVLLLVYQSNWIGELIKINFQKSISILQFIFFYLLKMSVTKMTKKYLNIWHSMILKIALTLILISTWLDKYIVILN